MKYSKLQFAGFYALLLVFFVATILIFLPYLKFLAFAAILAVLFTPVKDYLQKYIPSKTWSTLLTLLLVFIVILIPVWFVGQRVFLETVNVYNNFKQNGKIIDTSAIAGHVPAQIESLINNLNVTAAQKFSSLSANAFQSISSVASNVFTIFISVFLVLFSLYYFLVDGPVLKESVIRFAPFTKEKGADIVSKVEGAVNGVIKGAFLVALLQGAAATVGFFIFHVPQPFLWGGFTVLAALVPTVGTSISLVPSVLYLFITGHTGAAIGMAIWAATAVGLLDNFISPRLIGSRINVHPLLVLFSVLGGIGLFGFIGFLLGPIITAILLTLINVYRTDFQDQWE